MHEFLELPFARQESQAHGWITAVYQVRDTDYETVAQRCASFAVGQSIGTWVEVPGITQQMIEERQARILGIYETSFEDEAPIFILRLSFPTVNFGNSISMMLTALVGNDVSTSLAVRLVALEYPDAHLDGYTGPKLNMANLRGITGVEAKRPLVLNMIKPCTGFSPEEGAKLFREVALGGVDMIKDDELLGSPSYNQVKDRVKLYLKEAQEVSDITGKRTLYIPNISGTPKQIAENVEAILDAGARACLFNFIHSGLDILKEVCDQFGEDLFIMGHYAGSSVFAGMATGISDAVMVGTLPRLCGAGAVMTMMPNRSQKVALYNYLQTIQAQVLDLGHITPMIPTVGGGITPQDLTGIQKELGSNSIIGIGGAIQGHPLGSTAGARATMMAVECVARGDDLAQAARENEELAIALSAW